MGSEHYCLRWNNHQSNLLGVFSQLLQDESLVDVTLACSEGAPIRAHKVVLSACSSYFQSLFLDHPEKHPIVILKDVRFAELQTLVEFMYKGEVNVQYCQLSALLKTAESLKVKGLAEMTNQNTCLREPEREPERLRPHSQPSKSNTCDSPLDASFVGSMSATTSNDGVTTTATTITTAPVTEISATTSTTSTETTATAVAAISTLGGSTIGSKRTDHNTTQYHHHQHHLHQHQHHPYQHHHSGSVNTSSINERCNASPPKRLHCKTTERNSPLPLDLYQKRTDQQQQDELSENYMTNKSRLNEKPRSSTSPPLPAALIVSGTSQKFSSSTNSNEISKCSDISEIVGVRNVGASTPIHTQDVREIDLSSPDRSISTSCDIQRREVDDEPMLIPDIEKAEDIDDVEYGDEEMDLEDDGDNSCEEVGLNMKIGLAAALVSPNLSSNRLLDTGMITTIDVDSARSTPLTSSEILLSEQHLRRSASQGSKEVLFGSGDSVCGTATGIRVETETKIAEERSHLLETYCSLSSATATTTTTTTTGTTAISNIISPVASTTGLCSGETLSTNAGLGPVQSVPLSLKKEIDCDDDNISSNRYQQPRSASASGILGCELDYRTSHEALSRNFGITARCPTPFAFPFSPLGLSLFDIDPSRILSMLHHQSWFAEETLRHRSLLKPSPTSKNFVDRFNSFNELLSKEYQLHGNQTHVSTADILIHSSTSNAAGETILKQTQKQQPQQQQQHSMTVQQIQYKQQQPHLNVQYPPPPPPPPPPATTFLRHHQKQQQQQQAQQQLPPSGQKTSKITSSPSNSPHHAISSTQNNNNSTENLIFSRHKNDSANALELSSPMQHDEAAAQRDRDSGNSSAATTSSITSPLLYKDSLEQLLQKHRTHSVLPGEISLKAYSQMLLNAVTPPEIANCKEKSSSSSTSSSPPLSSAAVTLGQQTLSSHHMLKSPSESSSLFSEPIEEETRCVTCNAHFPNVWLLEQHASLQHPILGPGDGKPFICEQCGQSYRYRSAYAKHKEQNHRARLPADKLFTCDVCGMQFRYLKSFKKHRLNHALERLHGKKGSAKHQLAGSIFAAHFQHLKEHEMITSTQELVLADQEAGEDLRINIKKETNEEDQEQQQQHPEELLQQKSNEEQANANIFGFTQNNTIIHNATATELNINHSEEMHSTNSINTPLPAHYDNDPSFHPHHHHHQLLTRQHHLNPYPLAHHTLQHSLIARIPGHLSHNMASTSGASTGATMPPHQTHGTDQTAQQGTVAVAAAAAATTLNSMNTVNSIASLINSERLPNDQFLGLNPQEASILNFLRADAAERQRDKRAPASRFACPFCGKCVRSKENLKLHVRKHTGERPFVCLFCGRAFGGKSDLTRHLRIHTGERPYHCESCGKCFARADYLSKHLTTHIHNAPR